MPKIIDLIETSPGEWRFVKRLRLAWDKRFKQDAETRREQFFESLAGEAIKPKPDRWWTGWVGVALVTTSFFFAILFANGLGNGLAVIATLITGHAADEAFVKMLRAAAIVCLSPWFIVIGKWLVAAYGRG